MKKQGIMVLILLLFVVSVSSGFASTMAQMDFKCPVCGTAFKAYQNMSYTTFGTLRDFQKEGAISGLYENMIISCPNCHFAGFPEDFNKAVDQSIKEKVLSELKTVNPGKPLDDITECEFAAKIYIWKKAKNNQIAHIYLVGSYLLRNGTGEGQQKRIWFQNQAAAYLEKALAAGELKSADEKGSVNYLIGELCRRTGKFDEALIWFDKAKKIKGIPDGLKKWITEQKTMAEKKDAGNNI
ncbi:MAG: DUF2225 domain-containing protein [Firmicutes bacterium]|nr:DUF2225 domain-containing protein [Bacillota bacterium]